MLTDPEAITRAATMGLGIAFVAMQHAVPHLNSGALVHLLPDWHADIGAISLYFASQKLMSAKTRVFIDFVVEQFKQQGLEKKFSAA